MKIYSIDSYFDCDYAPRIRIDKESKQQEKDRDSKNVNSGAISGATNEIKIEKEVNDEKDRNRVKPVFGAIFRVFLEIYIFGTRKMVLMINSTLFYFEEIFLLNSRDDASGRFLFYFCPFFIICYSLLFCFICGTLEMALIAIFLPYLHPSLTICFSCYTYIQIIQLKEIDF